MRELRDLMSLFLCAGNGTEGKGQSPSKIREKIFSGKYHVNFGYFVNFSYIYIFGQQYLAPKVD